MTAPFRFGLNGRRAVVTGHRGGIGGAVAALFAAGGATVVGLDLPDFDREDVAMVATRAATRLGDAAVDILVNCAGTTVVGAMLDTPADEAERVFPRHRPGARRRCAVA